MNHPDIERMESTGLSPGEGVGQWDGESVTIEASITIYRDDLPDQIENADDAIEQASQMIRDRLSGWEYEIHSAEAE